MEGFNNSEIATPAKPTAASRVKESIKIRYALSDSDLRVLRKEQTDDLQAVLSCFCLKLGCQHRRLEHFCATGVMAAGSIDDGCEGMCSICLGEYDEFFLPLSKEGVISFFQREDGLRDLATEQGLLNLVWKNEYWTTRIFDQKVYQTHKYNIEAMFLQLLAARFIAAKCTDDGIHWMIGREDSTAAYPPYRYIAEVNWAGINLLPTNYRCQVALSRF